MSELRVGSSPSPIALLLVAIAILGAWVFLSGKKSGSAATTQSSQNIHEEEKDKKSTRKKSSERHSLIREDEEDEPPSAASTMPATPASASSETATTPPASAVDTEGGDRPRSKERRKSREIPNVAPETLHDEGDADARPDRAQPPTSFSGEGGGPVSGTIERRGGGTHKGVEFVRDDEWTRRHDDQQERRTSGHEDDVVGWLDFSRSPIHSIKSRGALGGSPVGNHILAKMEMIEQICRSDWFDPDKEVAWWGIMRANQWIPLFGNVPSCIVDIATAFAEIIPGMVFCEVMTQLIPRHDVIAPQDILDMSDAPTRDMLLAWFVLPFRAYLGHAWSGGKKKPRLPSAMELLEDPAASMVWWLDHMGTVFLASRMFSQGFAELLDDSMRIAIQLDQAEKGYIAEVTIMAPDPPTGDNEPVLPRTWATMPHSEPGRGAIARHVVGHCLNLARAWTERRGDGGEILAPGLGEAYQSGGDPIVRTRLVIRPGFSTSLNNSNPWPDNAKPAGATVQSGADAIPREPQIITFKHDNLERIAHENFHGSIAAFRQVVQQLRPYRLTILNARQNKWNPAVSAFGMQFDTKTFEYMLAHFTLGLAMEDNPYFEPDSDPEAEPPVRLAVNGGHATWTELDLGGILPLDEVAPGEITCMDFGIFPSLELVLLPFIALHDAGASQWSTANLLVDASLGLRTQLQLKKDDRGRTPFSVVVVLQDAAEADTLGNNLADVLRDRADELPQGEERKKWVGGTTARLQFRVRVIYASEAGPQAITFGTEGLLDAGVLRVEARDLW